MIRDTGKLWGRLGLIAAGLLVVTVPVAWAVDAPPRPAVEVRYPAAEMITDLGDNARVTTDARRNALLAQLTRHIRERAAPRIPAGGTLTVTIMDIDMAGDFETGRGPRAERARIVRDVYPPRIKLEFKHVDAGGKIVTEGRRELTDLAFMTSVEYRGDLLRYEKKLLDDWLAREFPGPSW